MLLFKTSFEYSVVDGLVVDFVFLLNVRVHLLHFFVFPPLFCILSIPYTLKKNFGRVTVTLRLLPSPGYATDF